jgi:hypothetical protein
MITVLTAGIALLVLLVIGTAAYHRGRRDGRVSLPADLVAELRTHKVDCSGEPPERVALEIRLLCDADGNAARSSSR